MTASGALRRRLPTLTQSWITLMQPNGRMILTLPAMNAMRQMRTLDRHWRLSRKLLPRRLHQR